MGVTRTLLFNIQEEEERLVEEITLTGVISGKVARGDYVQNPDYTQLHQAYESCHKVNELLHRKLNRVRRALDAEELVTESPEDES